MTTFHRVSDSRRQAMLVLVVLLAGAAVALLLLAPKANAVTPMPYASIGSIGPLSRINIGQDLGCQVQRVGDTVYHERIPA